MYASAKEKDISSTRHFHSSVESAHSGFYTKGLRSKRQSKRRYEPRYLRVRKSQKPGKSANATMATSVMMPHPPEPLHRRGSITPLFGPNTPRQGSVTPRQGSVTPRQSCASPRSPRTPRGRRFRPHTVMGAEYDSRLDEHQQVYMMSPEMMDTLQQSMRDQSRQFTDPKDKIGFHGPRRNLLLSYPGKPRLVGRAMIVTKYRDPNQPTSAISVPVTKDEKQLVRLAYHMRTGEFMDDLPGWKKLPRAKNVAPPLSRMEKLTKEKGFILDGIALSSIQDNFGKVQPKLGPAIPPYNSHFDKHVQSYFSYKGLAETLKKTGQTRPESVSVQGKAVDHFHFTGVGHDYIERRNKAGAGNSREQIDGHDQYLRDTRPMNTYNGKFGFRRNTPTLRHCPSPFGTASWSSTF